MCYRVFICINDILQLTVCSYHVKYTFQSESTLYSCLNVKDLLARSRREIWSSSDCNWTRTHNHLVHKGTLNNLAKLAAIILAKWLSDELSGCGSDSSCRYFASSQAKNHKYNLDCCQQKPQLFDENPFAINRNIHITNFVIPCENNAKCIRKK